jgi:sec-independent protein translocase protein TatA
MGDVAQGIKAFKKGMADDDKATTEPSEGQKTIDHRPPESSLQARAQTEQKAEGSNV